MIIGIDLGTTYSCVGVFKENTQTVEIIANEYGNRTTPSYVSFTDSERLIGEDAKKEGLMNIKNTIFDIKRLIGRKYSEIVHELTRFPYKIVQLDNDEIGVSVTWGKEHVFTPIEISSMILLKMKTIAEKCMNTKVEGAVITVPAYFNDAQRKATKLAGEIIGLNVMRIINEPTAASLAYGIDNDEKTNRNILVFDYGGGTFDVTVLVIGDGTYRVKSTSGDTHLGGTDIDVTLMNWVIQRMKVDVSEKAKLKIRNECEKIKRQLSNSLSAYFIFEYQEKDYKIEVTRNTFNELCNEHFNRCMIPVTKALKDAKIDKKDIHKVVMIGGSSRIPKISEMLIDYFGGNILCNSVNPDEAVAYGATLQAAKLTNTITKDLLLVDVTPLTLGVESKGGIMTPIIDRNSTIPVKKTKIFSTSEDNQPSVTIKIYEGERTNVSDNNLLDQFDLIGIKPAKRGEPRISVTFELDANGILNVSGEEVGSNIKRSIEVKNKDKLTDEQIKKMISDAEMYKEEDEKFRQRVEIKDKIEKLLSNMRNTLNEYESKLEEQTKKEFGMLILNKQKLLIENSDLELYKNILTELNDNYAILLKKI